MRCFKATTGDIYVGNVLSEVGNKVLMDNYSVWYEGDSEPLNNRHPDDSVLFNVDYEMPL